MGEGRAGQDRAGSGTGAEAEEAKKQKEKENKSKNEKEAATLPVDRLSALEYSTLQYRQRGALRRLLCSTLSG